MRTVAGWRAAAVAVLVVGAAVAIGSARMEKVAPQGMPLGEEVTIVFKRDVAGTGPVAPHRGAHQDPASTNLVGFLVSLDDSWACVRTERFVGAAVKPVYDDVWISRDSILLLVRTN